MATFYVWATLLLESAVDPLVAGLVRKGYAVGPLASNRNLMLACDASVLCSFQLSTETTENDPQQKVLAHVKEVLNDRKASWHSIIVSHVGGTCTWSGGNITFPKPEPKADPPPKEEGPLDKMDKAIGDS